MGLFNKNNFIIAASVSFVRTYNEANKNKRASPRFGYEERGREKRGHRRV